MSTAGSVPGGFKATSRVLKLTAAGALGGIAGFILSRMQNTNDTYDSESALRHATGIWFMLILVGIGAVVIAGNAYLEGVPPSKEAIGIGLASLVVGGYISGYIAQQIYASMLDLKTISDCSSTDQWCMASAVRPARALGWAVAGALGGAGVGAAFRSWKRVQNAVVGGAIGGLVGGLAFDVVPIITDAGESTSQLIGIVLIGTLVGCLISLIDTARSSMWLEVLNGEFKGRQFLVIDDRTTVGSARGAQVTLLADRSIKEHHLVIARLGKTASFDCATSATVLLNGSETSSGGLAHGDVIRLGNTDVRVGFRAASPADLASAASQATTPSASTGRIRLTASQANAESESRAGGPTSSGLPAPPATSSPAATETSGRPPEGPKTRPRLPIKPPS